MNVNVLVETKIKNNNMTFTYHVPDNLLEENLIGKRVLVPFGTRIIEGFVLEQDVPANMDVKDIIKVIDKEVVLNDELLLLGRFMKEQYLCSLISAYQVMLPKSLKAKKKFTHDVKLRRYVKLGNLSSIKEVKGKSQQAIIELLNDKKEVLKSSISSKSSLKKLIDLGIVVEFDKEIYREVKVNYETKKVSLTDNQKKVCEKISSFYNTDRTILLHGVTGSGKTEVYIKVVDEVLKMGKSAIILVPEISLTPQITARFKGHFGNQTAILHSALSDGERFDEWRRINRGEVKVVIGARSAVFAPLKNIGIIIIDEEHADTYKQENAPRYSAFDVATKRSKIHNCPLLLGSATPKIESYARAKRGYYELLTLDKRVNQSILPKVTIVDMKVEIRKGNLLFSDQLKEKIEKTISCGNQVMLLLNRRGYANYLTCQNCGYVNKCPNCDITLTYHKTSGMMRCHYCGYGTVKPKVCPSCKKDALRLMGSGTEKLEEQIKLMFPNAKVARMDADTTSNKGMHERIINDFLNEEYNILVGTQMIAKGLNFPKVTLVGVINSDSTLNIPNFRSSENTFSLLNQVVGRAGRFNTEGEAIIQTFNPEHYSITCASKHDYESFYNKEMLIRKKLNYPPYCFITLVKITSKDFNIGMDHAKKISAYLRNNLLSTTNVLGPSIANVLKVNNNYNFQVLLKYKKDDKLYTVLNNLIKINESNNKIKIELDFNPVNL